MRDIWNYGVCIRSYGGVRDVDDLKVIKSLNGLSAVIDRSNVIRNYDVDFGIDVDVSDSRL